MGITSICKISPGKTCIIHALPNNDNIKALYISGIRLNSKIKVINHLRNGTILVKVNNSRIVIYQSVSQDLLVKPL